MAENKGTKTKIKLFKKIMKNLFILLFVLLLTIQIIKCIQKYIHSPTYVTSKIVAQNMAEFPAISICPINNGFKLNILQAHGIRDIKNYNYKTNLVWSSNNTNITESELFDKVTYQFSELVQTVKIRYFRADPVSLSIK